MYKVYILQSQINKKLIYKGTTRNLIKRLEAHNSGENLSTSKYRPWKIIFYAVFASKEKAYNFEKYLKSGSGIAFIRKRLI